MQTDLPVGGVEQVRTPHNLRHTLKIVINDHGQLIGKQTIRPPDDKIADADLRVSLKS